MFLIHAPMDPLAFVQDISVFVLSDQEKKDTALTESPRAAETMHASCLCSKTGSHMRVSRWLLHVLHPSILDEVQQISILNPHPSNKATAKIYPLQSVLFCIHVPV